MASVKIKFRASSVSGKAGCLFYQLIHERSVRQIGTGCKIFASEWDGAAEKVRTGKRHGGDERLDAVRQMWERVLRGRKKLEEIIRTLGDGGMSYTADDVVALYCDRSRRHSFSGFMRLVISQLRDAGKMRTSQTYLATFRSFTAFRKGGDVMLDEITSDMMIRYEAWLRRRGVSMNTSSFYLRIIRATYNRAVDRGLAEPQNHFKHVYTGVERTVKRAVPIRFVKRIKDLNLPVGSSVDLARDMFLFSFYTRGMSFVDLAFLKKKNLQGGVLDYRRRKTGQRLLIKWEQCMQDIVDKYATEGTPYLLPIIKRPTEERRQYENAMRLVNNKLKTIARKVGLPSRLTMYVARHSWASAAKSNNIPLSVISEGMGHDSEKTTRIYLASLDSAVVDRANRIILKKL